MVELVRFGTGGVCDRELIMLKLPNLGELPDSLSVPSPHFACFIALNALNMDVQTIGEFADSLLSQGVVYVCAWGPDCERVHDIFDESIVGDGSEPFGPDFHVMTTWHNEETLEEALWFFLQCTIPSEKYSETCRSSIVLTIANTDWSTRARKALSNPEEFCNQIAYGFEE